MPVIKIIKRDGTALDVLVSEEDYADAAKVSWHMAGGKGRIGLYAKSTEYGYMHRWIAMRMGLIKDTEPEPDQRGHWKISVDHDNGNKIDNQRHNLKLKTRSQQILNPADGARSTSKSGVRGVILARPGTPMPWNVQATLKGKNYNLGWFPSQEEAILQRNAFDRAPDQQAWLDQLLASRLETPTRKGPKTDHPVGIVFLSGRYYASVYDDGVKVALGGYGTEKEAISARQSYLDSPDKQAWLRERSVSAQLNNKSSSHRGISYNASWPHRNWLAYVNEHGKRIWTARFDTEEEALAAREAFLTSRREG